MCSKAPAVGTMLLSGIMLKMGLCIIRWQLPITPLATKNTCTSSSSLGVAG
jgi:NADH-quinone oxidoreductase subunit M